jgi:hypothetical protein
MTDSVPGSPTRAITSTADDRGRIKHGGTTGATGAEAIRRWRATSRTVARLPHESSGRLSLRGRFRSKRVAPTSTSASAAGLIEKQQPT